MDPQELLWNLLDSIHRNDRASVDEHLEHLKEWNAKGGFPPEVEDIHSMTSRAYLVRRSV